MHDTPALRAHSSLVQSWKELLGDEIFAAAEIEGLIDYYVQLLRDSTPDKYFFPIEIAELLGIGAETSEMRLKARDAAEKIRQKVTDLRKRIIRNT